MDDLVTFSFFRKIEKKGPIAAGGSPTVNKFWGFVLGCVEAEFCNPAFVLQHSRWFSKMSSILDGRVLSNNKTELRGRLTASVLRYRALDRFRRGEPSKEGGRGEGC